MTDTALAPEETRNLPARRSSADVTFTAAGGGAMFAPSNLADVLMFAKAMANADIALPKHLRGNDGACLAVCMQAFRWEMDPFAVANKTYSVNDRLAYEAQLVAAVVHTRAPILRRPDYEFTGEGPSRVCTVSVAMRDGSTKIYTTPRFDRITTKNSPQWKYDPDQQLGYFAIRAWARRHTPEVILGVYTPDELTALDMGRQSEAGPPMVLDAAFSVPAALEASQAADEAIDAQVEEAAAEPGFDPVAWAHNFADALGSYTDADLMAADYAEHQEALRAASMNIFLQLDRRVSDRAIAIAKTGRIT